MALDELQWGRILALAWLEKTFRKKFETDPVKAFTYLKDHEAALRRDYGDYFLNELGLKGDGVVLTNFETMSWEGIDFWGMSGERLDECIQGINIKGMSPAPSPWFWGAQSSPAIRDEEKQDGEERTLTAEEWVRIYARLWMDYRIDESAMEEHYRNKYGPKKGYVEEFDRDPAAVVKKIAEEFNNKFKNQEAGWKPIAYDYGVTRLYAVVPPPPPDWTPKELTVLVKTGKVRDQSFRLVVNKC